MKTYKVKLEDKAALLNRLEKAGVHVNTHHEMFAIDSYTAQTVIEDLGYKYSTARWDHNGLGIS